MQLENSQKQSSKPQLSTQAKPNHFFCLDGEVKGAGEWYVNGVYTRTPQRVKKTQKGDRGSSSLVIKRKIVIGG